METFPVEREVERFEARRVVGWEPRDGAVVLQVEGALTASSGAGVAGAATGSGDQIEVAVAALESGALRLTVGLMEAPDQHGVAKLTVTTTAGGLHLVSERQGRFGPAPEDVHVEVRTDPLALAVVDAGGRTVLRLGANDEDAADRLSQPEGLSWTYVSSVAGLPARALPRRSVTIALALEPDERLFGFDAQSGPLDRVGSTRVLDPSEGTSQPLGPFLLSSRGPGLFVQTRARVTADLGATSVAVATLTVEEATLDLVVFPATWPRAALAAYTGLTGRPSVPPPTTFGMTASFGAAVSDGDAQSIADRLHSTGIPNETPGRAGPEDRATREIEGMGGADEFRRSLQAALALGLVAPGRWPPADEPPPSASPALYARWAQARLLMPFARVPIAPGAAPWGGGERTLAIFRDYARLRYRLLPYLLHCAQETAQQGLPMLRPLLLEFSWDADALTIDDQYLLGRDVLVAPIFDDTDGDAARRVYLPRYAHWYDWWTGQFFEGGQWLDVAAPLERIPLYARAGTAIPIGDARDTIGGNPVEVSRLLLFAPADGAIGASVELPDGEMLGVEHERGADRARIFIEGIPPSIKTLEIVGLSARAAMVDAASPRMRLVPGDGSLPGFGGGWDSITVALDAGAYTTGLELRW
jgi:hypothetical protein